MQKALRLGWVLLANGLVILVTLARLRSFYSAGLLHVQIVLEFVLEVLFPIVGIIAELIDWKFARTINVGYLCAAGCFWMVGALWDHSDPFVWPFADYESWNVRWRWTDRNRLPNCKRLLRAHVAKPVD